MKRPRFDKESRRKGAGKREHVDESEVWKRKTLASAANRRKFAKFAAVLMWVLAALVLAVCFYAYFIDGEGV